MNQADSKFRAGPQQPDVDKRRPVVDIDRLRNAAGGQSGVQRHPQPDSIFGEPEPVADQQPGMIIQEREQIDLAAADLRAVQRIPGPPLVRSGRFEPAEHLPADPDRQVYRH